MVSDLHLIRAGGGICLLGHIGSSVRGRFLSCLSKNGSVSLLEIHFGVSLGPPHFGESTALSANFHTSEIASLTPASLLFASGVTGNNSGASVNQSQQQRQSSNNNSAKRSHKSHQLQQQHCASAIQDVLAAAAQSRAGGSAGKIDNGDLSILNDLGVGNVKVRAFVHA